MDKILSQEEINALFSAMSSADSSLNSSIEKSPAARKITYNELHREDRISQDKILFLHLLYEFFSRHFASSLSTCFRNFVHISLVSVEQETYASFLKTLPDPTLFAVVGVRPINDRLALELNPSLVFPLVDMILEEAERVPEGNRILTEIDLDTIDWLLRLAIRDLTDVWNPIIDLDFFLEDKGTSSQMFQVASSSDAVITVSLEVKIGENTGRMNMCIPSGVLKQLWSKFDRV
jgi:flagellar motor switch protein FliM